MTESIDTPCAVPYWPENCDDGPIAKHLEAHCLEAREAVGERLDAKKAYELRMEAEMLQRSHYHYQNHNHGAQPLPDPIEWDTQKFK